VLIIPYAGFLVLAAAADRTKRTWFGLALMLTAFFPLLFLPGRLFAAYCYVPFLGLAVAVSGLAELARPLWLAAFFVAWLPLDYYELRSRRSETLARDADIQAYVTTVEKFVHSAPPIDTWIYSGEPDGFQPWGIEGALKYLTGKNVLDPHPLSDLETPALLQHGPSAVLTWNGATHRLNIEVRQP
jgi:hypothetical protein